MFSNMRQRLFQERREEKELIQKVSSLCGLKQDIIRQVWAYTFFNIYLSVLENSDKNSHVITIPYIANMLVRPDPDNKDEYVAFTSLSDDLKKIMKDIRNKNETGLIRFFQDNFVNKALDNVTEKQ